MSHQNRTPEQNETLNTLKEALGGEGSSLDALFPPGGGATGQDIEEDYYKAIAPGPTISLSYETIDSKTFQVNAGDHLVGINAIFGGTKNNRDYSVRVLVNGAQVGELNWTPSKPVEEKTLALVEEVNGLPLGPLLIEIQGKTSNASNPLYVSQWSVHTRKRDEQP